MHFVDLIPTGFHLVILNKYSVYVQTVILLLTCAIQIRSVYVFHNFFIDSL